MSISETLILLMSLKSDLIYRKIESEEQRIYGIYF